MGTTPNSTTPPSSFADQYRNISRLVLEGAGWIELGADDDSRSMVRILDEGGMLWEGRKSYPSMEALLADAEEGLIQALKEHGF